MAKYRKLPVVIEAVRLNRKYFDEAHSFIKPELISDFNSGEFAEDECYIDIKTLEGVMTANEGDWIIKGVNCEFYPCKNDIFEKTYEKVED